MHYALFERKRLLHHTTRYPCEAMTPNERLKIARAAAGYKSAVDAADALGMPRSTYIGHENGLRGFPAKRAASYAKKFKVTEEWLLYGKGEGPVKQEAEVAEVIDFMSRMDLERKQMLRDLARRLAGEVSGG
jgi:DNA-binding XRE family transcriptional regulator